MSKQKITEYRIIPATRRDSLVERVSESLVAEWQPFGGVCYDGDLHSYLQAMVKYEQCEVEDE